jgi:hypothetical protein
MGRTLDEVLQSLPPERQATIESLSQDKVTEMVVTKRDDLYEVYILHTNILTATYYTLSTFYIRLLRLVFFLFINPHTSSI